MSRAGRAVVFVALLIALIAALVSQIDRGESGFESQIEASIEDPRAASTELAAAALQRAARRWSGAPAQPSEVLSAPAPPLWLCRYRQAKPSCARGEGSTAAAAIDAAIDALGPDQQPVDAWKIDFELERSRARWPADANRHQAGTFGLLVGGAVVLPSEVLERGLFYTEDEDDPPKYDTERLVALLGERGALGLGESFAFERLRTASWVWAEGGAVRTYRVHAYEDLPVDDPDVLLSRVVYAAEHLASIVGPDGRIRYRFDPGLGQEKRGQNMLRHAGSTYSLLQAYARTGHMPWKESAERAIRYMLSKSASDERTGPFGGGKGRYLVEGSHIKLGGAGLALVALAEWQSVTGDRSHEPVAREFATYLLSQQQRSGEFVYFASRKPGGEPRDDTSAYYPGEAILGLVSQHALDGDPRWLGAARRGADWLIDKRDAGKGPNRLENDHWLMIALERLHSFTKDPRYIEHAKRLAEAVRYQHKKQEGHEARHRDYLGGYYEPPRSTPASTRAEGLVAVITLLEREGVQHDLRPLLLDTVGHLARSQYTRPMCYWVPDCKAIVGGFAGGIVDVELRNDYTQHALSAMLGTERILGRKTDLVDVPALLAASFEH